MKIRTKHTKAQRTKKHVRTTPLTDRELSQLNGGVLLKKKATKKKATRY
jgi:hypothetical protein